MKAERIPISDLVLDMCVECVGPEEIVVSRFIFWLYTLRLRSASYCSHSICGIQISGFENPFQFCSLFERANNLDLARKMELLQDLGDYYKKGIGDPNAFAMSCTLLEDFIMTADVSFQVNR
jgi:hypothetical protein